MRLGNTYSENAFLLNWSSTIYVLTGPEMRSMSSSCKLFCLMKTLHLTVQQLPSLVSLSRQPSTPCLCRFAVCFYCTTFCTSWSVLEVGHLASGSYVLDSDGDKEVHDSNLLSRAQIFLERARALDPDNIVANEFLHKVWTLSDHMIPSSREFTFCSYILYHKVQHYILPLITIPKTSLIAAAISNRNGGGIILDLCPTSHHINAKPSTI